MKENELRIGNLVYFNKTIVEITELRYVDCTIVTSDFSLNRGASYKAIRPIPLTDEILRDWCGFNMALRVHYGLTKHGIDLVPAGDAYYDNRTGRKITDLHTLQNFVFAVSGTELEVIIPTV